MAGTAKPKTTKTTKKPAGAATAKAPRKTATKTSSAPKASREHMIAEAAYYKAEKRGFSGGDHVRDWLEAEAEIGLTAPKKRKAPAKK
ncbi:MAG TPA: DUF2934 domain-containing protein [Mariprofundaceae bacterium]|nr:DUF2934 domain-containing protein [Mariprofundaceae bacterium]